MQNDVISYHCVSKLAYFDMIYRLSALQISMLLGCMDQILWKGGGYPSPPVPQQEKKAQCLQGYANRL